MVMSTFRLSITALGTALLAACGGGGDDSPATTPPTTVTAVTLSGTAAKTAPIATGTVSAKCLNATGSAAINSSAGAYTLKIEGASLPCMVRVTGSDSTTVLHSVATGSGAGTAVANVTPFTELIVAKAAGTGATSLYDIYDATTNTLLTSTRLAAAKALLADALKVAGIDITADAPLTDSFLAADAKGLKIAALETRLAAGQTTLAALESALINASTTAAATPVVVAALTAPPVANCLAVRSVPYRVVHNDAAAEVIQPNFATGAVAASATIAFSGTTACQAQLTSGAQTQEVNFASSGVFLTGVQATGQAASIALGFPEQTIALADLVGTWNTVEYGIESSRVVNFYATLTIDAAGVVSVSECTGLAACVATTAKGSIVVNAAGGFDLRTPDGELVRIFAFRNAEGRTMLVAGFNPGMLIAAKQATSTLPTLGSSSVTVDAQLSGAAVFSSSLGSVTVTAVDAASSTVTRTRASDGRVDSVVYNSPRAGMRNRLAGSFNGTSFASLIQVPTGVGIVAFGGATSPLFGLSLTK